MFQKSFFLIIIYTNNNNKWKYKINKYYLKISLIIKNIVNF